MNSAATIQPPAAASAGERPGGGLQPMSPPGPATRRPSNLSSQDHLERYLRLAERARKDRALVPNHLDGGVDTWLTWHLIETRELLTMVRADPQPLEREFLHRLLHDETRVLRALSSYPLRQPA